MNKIICLKAGSYRKIFINVAESDKTKSVLNAIRFLSDKYDLLEIDVMDLSEDDAKEIQRVADLLNGIMAYYRKENKCKNTPKPSFTLPLSVHSSLWASSYKVCDLCHGAWSSGA